MASTEVVTSPDELLTRYTNGDRSFQRASLRGADLQGVVVPHALLSGAVLEFASLQHADLSFCWFRGANLSHANLLNANLRHADFESGTPLNKTRLDGANLRGANLEDAILTSASLKSANLEGARLVAASLRKACLQGANLRGANLADVDFLGADLRDADLRGALVDVLTLTARQIEEALGIDYPHELEGLTLYFDTRLHRFDPTAFDAFIAEVLSSETDVTIEERSNIGADGPSFLSINGSNPEDLLAVAEAFYDRVWKAAVVVVEEMAVEKAMSSGMAVLLQRLDAMRDAWTEAALNHPDVQEMMLDHAADHMLEKDTPANLYGRLERITGGLADHAKKKVGKIIGTKTADALIDASRQTVEDAFSGKDRRDVERWDRKMATAELDEPDDED